MTTALTALTTFLIDLDGVIYRGEELLPGAKDFVNWLETRHKKYLFLTNNSFASDTQVVDKLTRLGIETTAAHVLGAGQAAVKNIAHRFPSASVYVIGEAPLVEMVQQQGLAVANDDPASIDVVLVGLDRMFDYKKLDIAVRAIRAGAAFIAINRDPLLPLANSLIAGCGTMVAALEAGSEVTPEVIGKPQPTLLQEAMRTLGTTPQETVMIGDNLGVDILAGQAAHTHTLFVLSGKDTRANLANFSPKPEYVYGNLADVLREIEQSV